MESYSRKKMIEKIFEAVLKERLSQLARKYAPSFSLRFGHEY
jgi:hypothetical protein